MRFRVLGPLEVRTDDGAPVRVPEAKVRLLLADLLSHDGRPVPVERLVDDLWGARPPRDPAAVLRTKVAQLRRAFDLAQPGGRDLVVWQPSGYALRVEADAVDVRVFGGLLERARAGADAAARAALLAEALELWRGDAYADFAGEVFLRGTITRLAEQRLTAMEELAEVELELGRHDRLLGELAEQVGRHPLRERFRAVHMRALYRAGRQSDALDTYHDLRKRLADELGVDPSPELAAIYQAILAQDTALTGPASRTNLPVPLTGLIGREEATARLIGLVETNRLVTLTGPGGVGKTRLAIAAATHLATRRAPTSEAVAGRRQAAGETSASELVTGSPASVRTAGGPGVFPDGVWLVELAALDHPARGGSRTVPADVATLVAAALGLADAGLPGPQRQPVPVVERVVAAVRERRMLLVLDNCEHVVGPAAELAAHLLSRAPGLRILATGREPLGISGEWLQVVTPLEVPDAGADPEQIARSDAARLFLTRAAAATGELPPRTAAAAGEFPPRTAAAAGKSARPTTAAGKSARTTTATDGFPLGAHDAEAVAVICRRLDGLPLALELAAARVRSLGVREVARRLDARFRLLTRGPQDAPARHQTLRAVIDWSWELLTGPERGMLCRLAPHPGGCTLETAQAVADLDPDDVVDVLAALVDRSLVIATAGRYHLAGSVAAYCVERLDEAGELTAVRQRHDEHYADLAERAGARLRGPGQHDSLRLLDAETANLRGVLDDALRRRDGTLVTRLTTALAWYWTLRGRLEEAHRSFTRALELESACELRMWRSVFALMTGRDPGTPADPGRSEDPRAQWLLASSLYGVGDLAGSERLTRQALATFESRGDAWGTAAARNTLAWHALARGATEAAGREAGLSLEAFTELGDPWGQMLAMESLASVAEATGRRRRAAVLFERSLSIAERLGFGADVPFKLCGLADVHLATGEHRQAGQLYERARRLASEQSIRLAETYALIGLGRVARRTDRLDAAETYLRVVLDGHRRHGHEPSVAALTLTELGFLAHHRGNAGQAEALHRESCRIAHAGGDPRTIAQSLEGLAGALALAGRDAEAARLLGTAAAARREAGAPLPPADRPHIDRATATVREALGSDAYTGEFERGGHDYATGEWFDLM